ncbi:hypothetical protein HanXRQr2_Chr15g0678401 [Helianthus annuus]|uniref:Uncharacterized protein n=1 Tax=Helianthus annuus TaxID=4232 RepID=A0A9K3DZ19_HELAN|nr:hypothetical protein HanXRQr2_Chr15g0678401 [Helianthus annuus]KAJ0830018.1 hypothetical protein HanPSC8_Chr15g0650411 [Helianthus annuus]
MPTSYHIKPSTFKSLVSGQNIGSCSYNLTYMSKKVITAVSMREFSISLPGDYLQHENTKTKYIRFYRKTPVYCVLWRNVTAACKQWYHVLQNF